MARIAPIGEDALPAGAWRTEVKLRFGHCDPAGIVYTPAWFDLFNGVVEDFYPGALGLDYHALIGPRRIGLGYAKAGADFLRPGRMGETARVAVLVPEIGRASFALRLHAMLDGAEAVRGAFVTVATDLDTHRPIPLPDDLRAALESYRARCPA